MTVVVQFHRLATGEYLKARSWYRQRSPMAALRFESAIADALIRISNQPKCGAPFTGPVRWVRTRKFPYTLYYEEVTIDRAILYSIAHNHRRPGYWTRRRKVP